jgi:hypothetical protein
MDFHVLVQVGFLRKAEVAALDQTGVGSLACVDPQVVEEVVPFTEMFATILVIALKDLNVPFGFGIFESKNSELFG